MARVAVLCVLALFVVSGQCYFRRQLYERPIVTVTEGRVRGAVKTLLDGSFYYSFKGIPYATAPTGPYRFQSEPFPVTPWHGVRDAMEHGPICPQLLAYALKPVKAGEEECLFINVYTRSLTPAQRKPVMFFIHPGFFMMGSGDTELYSPELFLENDVVFVTFNYRLEALGFMSMDNPEIPGNGGMKDMIAALLWVKNNIARFGGDPDNVTVFGEGAGASAATYLMMSPRASGLFHKVIAQSGTCFDDWAQGRDMKERAFRTGLVLGKDTENEGELIQFLRSEPAMRLANITEETTSEEEYFTRNAVHFVPVVEKRFPGVQPFIDEDPIQQVLQGRVNKVPIMLGYNNGEGINFIGEEMHKFDVKNQNVSYFVPRSIAEVVPKHMVEELGHRIKMFYGGGRAITKDQETIIRDIITDTNFAYNIHRFAYLYSKFQAPVYMYKFNLDTELNVVKNYSAHKHMAGASHADDLFYMFLNNLNRKAFDSNPKLQFLARRVVKLWTNFAKYGAPTPDGSMGVAWPPYTPVFKDYFNIQEFFSVDRYADWDHIEFWNQLFREAGLPHIGI